jgi:hypothetical protein
MPKPKGSSKIGGRTRGTPNKFTKSVKEAFEIAFNELQDDPKANLAKWAKDNTTEFYKLAAKLIPTSLTAEVNTPMTIKVIRDEP